METMEPANVESSQPEPPQQLPQDLVVSDVINCNNENENVLNTRIDNNNQSKMTKTNVAENSPLNPNAVPFYPLQQLQNLNHNVVAGVANDNAIQNYNNSVTQMYNMNAVNNMSMFHQAPNQILVLRLPGPPIHNESGIQFPQMIIPLQIPVPVPVAQDHNYHQTSPVIYDERSIATTPSTPMSVSPFEATEIARHSSPVNFELTSPEMTELPKVPSPEIARLSPITKNEDLDMENMVPEVIEPKFQQETPKPRFKIPSPTKMTTRSRTRKPVESEKRQIEESTIQVSEIKPKSGENNSVDTKRIILSKKAKHRVTKVEPQPSEGSCDQKLVPSLSVPTPEVANNVEIPAPIKDIKVDMVALMDASIKKTNKAKTTKVKMEPPKALIKTEVADLCETNVNVKQELVDLTEETKVKKESKKKIKKRDKQQSKAGPSATKIETVDIESDAEDNVKMEVKKEEPFLDELPDLDQEDEEDLPIITCATNSAQPSSSSIPSVSSSAEQDEFEKEVQHYSKPEVQCQIFFPKLVVKRTQVRGDRCSVEYAVSGRSHCRICKQTIKKEELRFSIPVKDNDFGYGNVIDTWHHARCFWGAYKVRSTYHMYGLEYLAEKDQRLVHECVRNLK